ncbi:uncharacterized protein PAC_08967 [Phialocephala subalpina]|uniref:Guanine nucleotide-exchange factor SEC12 n=1 Tax=Phialocephala subalpina TaxID=576137 RepID=A0A1L7X222_9HELO|nr:uncharacterized protein PAC_08967 [Phialocephala subalpina]
MAPLIPSAKLTLSYPLYACDFDPLDSSRLVVGGGGGAGRTGVGNKITLIDTSNSTELQEAAEIELSKDEDNVTSLAVGAKKDKATLVFAGVNSSPADVEKGRNAHFRVLGIEPPKVSKKGKDASEPSILEHSRASLFQGREKDAYQRITRLSNPFPNQPQLGAVATGLARNSEIVLFDTSTTSPPRSRGAVTSNKEAEDVDFIQTGDDEFLFAYCDEHDIYLKKISHEADEEEPDLIYITPATRGPEKPSTPKFRAMRFLSKEFLIMLTNIHSNGGVVLQIFRIPPSGKGQCRLAQSHRLPDRITKATGLAVCNLTPPTSPSEPQGYTQFVVAVAGHDISLSLFKVDLQVAVGLSVIMSIKSFRTLRNVHPLQITSLAFSNFTPPAHPITASTPPQYLKLASVGVANTVVVHTFPLFPVPLSMKRGQSTTPRYVIALPSTAAAFGMGVILSFIGIALAAIFIQGILEIRGGVPVYLNARNHLPVIWQEALGRPFEFPSGYNDLKSPISSSEPEISKIQVRADPETQPKTKASATTTREETMTQATREEAEATGAGQESCSGATATAPEPPSRQQEKLAKKLKGEGKWNEQILKPGHEDGKKRTWKELAEHEKEHYKKALGEGVNWAEELPENVFKGVLFGELGGAVGRAIAGA